MRQLSQLNQVDKETWKRIQQHQFGMEGASLTFAARLARENRWSQRHSERVVEEYRRFCLLAAIMDHPVTPSEAVDAVWHLHLTYSRDYWEKFCPTVLGAEFHHEPTLGGQSESGKFHDWYATTLASYRSIFGEPPQDIWPAPNERFANADKIVQLNSADYFIVSKKRMKQTAAFTGLAVAGTLTTSVAAASENSFDNWLFVFGLGIVALIVIIFISVAMFQSKKKGDNNSSCGGYGSSSKGDGGSDGGSGCGGGCGGCGG